jgi:hypothetical protein
MPVTEVEVDTGSEKISLAPLYLFEGFFDIGAFEGLRKDVYGSCARVILPNEAVTCLYNQHHS